MEVVLRYGADSVVSLRDLYPSTSPHAQESLPVSGGHTLHWRAYGNPRGVPALFVHGGPGAGCYPNHARFFDPKFWRIILVDQRGCGASTPRGRLEGNTTADLVADFEALRAAASVRAWGCVLGGSWGVALALAYAQAYPDRVRGLVLRGVCLMRSEEIAWMYGGGAAAVQPRAWRKFVEHLPPEERHDVLGSYYARLRSPHAAVRDPAAQSWMGWEMAVGFRRLNQLQIWDGRRWSQEEMPGRRRMSPPRGRPRGAAAPLAAPSAGGDGAGGALSPTVQSNGVSPVQSNGVSPDGNGSGPLPAISANDKNSGPNNIQSGSGSGSGNRGAAREARQPWETAPVPPARPRPVAGAKPSPAAVTSGAAGSQNSSALLLSADSARQSSGGDGTPEVESEVPAMVAQPLLECHYSLHGAFLPEPLLKGVERIRHIPCVAVQGRLDFVTPVRTAYDLHRAWPEMELRVVPDCGHSMYDAGIKHHLLEATDSLRALHDGSLCCEENLHTAVY